MLVVDKFKRGGSSADCADGRSATPEPAICIQKTFASHGKMGSRPTFSGGALVIEEAF
jgi:hypothetical protein